jgi:hypothetical protein
MALEHGPGIPKVQNTGWQGTRFQKIAILTHPQVVAELECHENFNSFSPVLVPGLANSSSFRVITEINLSLL